MPNATRVENDAKPQRESHPEPEVETEQNVEDAPSANFARLCKKAGLFIVQLTFLAGVCYLGNAVAGMLPIGIPGNIVSMALLLTLLITGMLDAAKIDLASNFLLKYMPVFFIPAGVSIMGCFPVIAHQLPQFALVCIITTILVFVVTSATVTGAIKLQARLSRRKGGDKPAGKPDAHASSTVAMAEGGR